MYPSVTGKRRADAGKKEARSASLDKEEFESLYRQARSALWCIAAGMLDDRTHAEDVVQDAALIAYQRRDQFTPGTSFLAWTARIVRNVALNARRRLADQRTSAIDATEISVIQSNGAVHARERSPLTTRGELKPDQDAFDDRVLAALMELSPQARACLLLRTVLDMSYSEIATALDIPEGTAMSHVYRSRHLLRSSVLISDDKNQSRSVQRP